MPQDGERGGRGDDHEGDSSGGESDTPLWDGTLIKFNVLQPFVQAQIDQALVILAQNDATQIALEMEQQDLEVSKINLATLKYAMDNVELAFVDASELSQACTTLLAFNVKINRNLIQLEGRIKV